MSAIQGIKEWFIVLLPGLFGFITGLLPTLTINQKFIIILLFTAVYYFITTVRLQLQLKKFVENENVSQATSELNCKKINDYKEFVFNRKLFMKHDLTRLKDINREYYNSILDKFRGKKNDPFINEAKQIRDAIEQIITKEERAFDEQLYKIQSDKDN